MSNNRSARVGLAGILLALTCAPVAAVDLGAGVQFHGFVSQGLIHTSDNNFGGTSDDGIATDARELGVNLSWRPNPDWLLSGQVLSRWAGETDEGGPRIDYAFVERALFNDGAHQISLSLGKIKNPYGFFNTTRDVAHTRPGILLPQSIYMERMRDFFLAAPGVALRGEHDSGDHYLGWQVGGMKMQADNDELNYVFLPVNTGGRFEGRASWLAQGLAELDGARWRAGLSFGDVAMDYRPRARDPIPAGVARMRPLLLSLQHNRESWTFTAELARVEVISQPIAYQAYSEGAYIQATWRPALEWSVWLRREGMHFNVDDKAGRRYTVRGQETYRGRTHATVLGVRHDFTPDLALSAEWHRIEGVGMLSPQDNPDGFTKDWDMVLLQAAYRF